MMEPNMEPNTEPNTEPKYARTYFKHLEGEYFALPKDLVEKDEHKICSTKAKEIIAKGNLVDRDDLFQLELYLLRMLPPEKLRRKAWITRLRHSDLAGIGIHDTYLLSNPPKDNDVQGSNQLEELRADLEVLLQDSFWHPQIRAHWENACNGLSIWFAILALVGLGAIVGLIHYLHPPTPWYVFLAVTATGAIGGLVSMMRRLQSISDVGKRLSSLVEMESLHGKLAILSQSLISGAIFANVLFWVFISGLVQGDFFPQSPVNDNIKFFKAIVWSFVAGFAERFVPDTLDRIIASGQASGDSKPK